MGVDARSTRSPSTNCFTNEPLQLEPPHIFREKMRLFTSSPRLVPCTPCICGTARDEPVIGTRRHLRGVETLRELRDVLRREGRLGVTSKTV